MLLHGENNVRLYSVFLVVMWVFSNVKEEEKE